MYAERRCPRAMVLLPAVALFALGSCTTSTTAVTEPVASVLVTPTTGSLFVGATTQLVATPNGSQGEPLKGREVTWSSSDLGVATVSSTGLVTGVGGGSATITATSEGQSDTATISVAIPVASVEVQPASLVLQPGAGGAFSVVLRDASGAVLSGRQVAWTSSNPAVATVGIGAGGSQIGLVLGVAVGTSTITATSEGVTGTGVVTVQPPVATVDVTPPVDTLLIGDTVRLSAVARDAGGAVLANRTVAWSSSNDAVAIVDSTGLVTAIDIDGRVETPVTITAMSGGRTGTSAIVVTVVADTLQAGDVVASSIGAAAEVDYYGFSASDLDRLLLTIVETSGFVGSATPHLTVFSPSGAQFSETNASAQQLLTPSEDGFYLVRVRANNLVSTGGYSLGLEGLSPISSDSVSIALGDVTAATITAPAEVDLYTFDAGANERVAVTLVETSGFLGSAAPNMAIYAPSGTLLGGVSFNATTQQLFTLPEAGKYVVRVQPNNLFTAGGYSLGLEGFSPITGDSVSIGLGDVISATIGVPGEVDLYTFDAATSDRIATTLVETSGFAGSAAPNMAIYSPSGTLLAGVGFNANTQQLFTLPETGKYLVRVQPNNLFTTGGYSLGLEGLSPITSDSVSIGLGDVIAATIGVPAEVDLFTFDAATNDQVLATLVETSGFLGSAAPNMAVYSPSGVLLGGVDFNANTQQLFTMPETGKYVIRVHPNNLVTTGGYSLGLEGLSPISPDSTSIGLGDLIASTIGAPAEVDLFTFDASANDRVFATLVETSGFAGSAAPNMGVYTPSGTLLGGLTYNANSQQLLTLPESGKYVIRVQPNNLVTTGGYALGLEGLSPVSADSVSIGLGDLMATTIALAGEVDLYTFDATADDRVLATLVETSGFAGSAAPNMGIYTPSGALLGGLSYNANTQRMLTLPETGKYVIRVHANNLITTGGYSLGWEGDSPVTPGTTALSRTDIVSGSVSAAGATDLYTFSASAGEDLDITLTTTSGFAGAAPQGVLISPSGTVVGSAFNGTTTRNFTNLPETGTYVIRVTANTLVHTGTYDLEVQ